MIGLSIAIERLSMGQVRPDSRVARTAAIGSQRGPQEIVADDHPWPKADPLVGGPKRLTLTVVLCNPHLALPGFCRDRVCPDFAGRFLRLIKKAPTRRVWLECAVC